MKYRGFILLPTVLLLALIAAISYMLLGQSGTSLGLSNSELSREKAAMLAEAGLARALWSANQNNCINYASTGNRTLGAGNYTADFSASSSSPVKVKATGRLPDGSSQLREISAAIYSTERKTGVLQSANFIEATTIDPGNASIGAPGTLVVAGNGKRGLFRIDNTQIDSIVPDGSYIESAVLQFQVASSSGDVSALPIYALTKPWKRDSASWNNAEVSTGGVATPWSSGGGDFAPAAITTSSAATTFANWDITSLVRGWKSQRMANRGGLLALPAGAGSATLTVSNLADNAQNPKLIVVYRCNCGDARCRFGIDTDKNLAYWVLYPTIDFGLLMQNKQASLSASPIALETGDVGHVVFKFDFSGKPNIGEIIDIRLNLFAEGGANIAGSLTASAYLIKTNWNPGSSGWDNQLVSQGIYYDSASSIGNANVSTSIGLKTFYVAHEALNGWLAGTQPNYGMTIFFPNVAKNSPVPRLDISSMDSPIVSQRPQLVIAYLPK
jgi:hypothetical protein